MDDDSTIINPQIKSKLIGNSDIKMSYQPELKVSLFNAKGLLEKQYSFSNKFTVGRSPDNDIALPDPLVSRYHFDIRWEDASWWINDLNSANGTFLDGNRITQKTRLEFPATLALGKASISLKVEDIYPYNILEPNNNHQSVSNTGSNLEANQPYRNLSKEEVKARLFSEKEANDSGEFTRIIRSMIHEDRTILKKNNKRFVWIASTILLLLICVATYQQMALDSTRKLAIDMFYDIKTLEISLSQAEIKLKENAEVLDLTMKLIVKEKLGAEQEKIQKEREKITAERLRISSERQKLVSMKNKYQQYVQDTKLLSIRFPSSSQYIEELITRVARGFGENELEVPSDFVAEVQRYIQYWQKSSRMSQAMKHLEENSYTSIIIDALEKEGLPLYFMYLPLQESNYNAHAIGPETRFGIAKGAWQFLATTAQDYGLRSGPLANSKEYDPQDERFNFIKATQAGAKHLKHIYSTEAQASGLLVMASYNYGHTRVRNMINKMQENPRERNFWKFIQQNNLPKETYDYVFYIFSAAVIGEDPKYFGFNFKSPLLFQL
ncbi:MAG: FHA domain-containing protein [Nitrosomonas sp.]|nr:FHA domain-containing protein [Nitrosomonas sp.]